MALVATVLAAAGSTAFASPGEIVASWDGTTNGIAQRPANVAVLRTSDNHLITVGDNNTGHAIVMRQSANGTLDHTFGAQGTATITLPNGGSAEAAVLQADGKILIAGTASRVVAGDELVATTFVMRLTAQGHIDTAFGTNGVATVSGTGTTNEQLHAIAITPDAKVVVGGTSGTRALIARLTATGHLDSSFGTGGRVLSSFGTQPAITSLVVQPDSKIVAAGSAPTAALQHFLLARYRTNGTLDPAFGTGGRVNPSVAPFTGLKRVALQGTSIVVGGEIGLSTGVLARFGTTGVLDTSFSGGMRRFTAGAFTRLNDFAFDGSGHIVVAAVSSLSTDFPGVRSFVTLFRYSPNGATDLTFGCSGRVITELLGTSATRTYQASNATAVDTIGSDIYVGAVGSLKSTADLPPTDDVLVRYRGSGDPHGAGYTLVRRDGGMSAFGGAPPCGSVAGASVTAPIVGMANDPVAPGTWSVAADGGVFAFGTAHFFGSTGAIRLNRPIVGMAPTPTGKGYWLVASDGGVFSFGDAHFLGSMGGRHLNQPIVGIAATPSGHGYWMVATDGGIFSFGDARFHGSMGSHHLNRPMVGISSTKSGHGYWTVASDGGIFSFGDAHFAGSTGSIHLRAPIVGMAHDPDGDGYWLAASDGGVFAFRAAFLGSTGVTPFPPDSPQSTVGIAVSLPGPI